MQNPRGDPPPELGPVKQHLTRSRGWARFSRMTQEVPVSRGHDPDEHSDSPREEARYDRGTH
jgi:hypothetical protein